MRSVEYSTNYRVFGPNLDVAALIAAFPPRATYEVWRRGEVNVIGKKHVTSGVQIDLVDARSTTILNNSVVRFLRAERRFLRAVSKLRDPKVKSVLRTGIFVYAEQPATVHLRTDALALAAKNGVEWTITGYPCSD